MELTSVRMRPPESASLPFRVDVINGWPLFCANANQKIAIIRSSNAVEKLVKHMSAFSCRGQTE